MLIVDAKNEAELLDRLRDMKYAGYEVTWVTVNPPVEEVPHGQTQG